MARSLLIVRRAYRASAHLPRPRSGIVALVVMIAAFLAIFANTAFWRELIHVADLQTVKQLDFGVTVFAALLSFFVLVLTPVTVPRLFKPLAIALVLVASVCAYFMNTYGIVIDDTMIRNVIETDRGEAAGLFDPRLVLHLVLTGVLPAILIALWRVRRRALLPAIGVRVAMFLVAGVVLSASVYVHYKDFALLVRTHRDLRYRVNPTYPIYAAIKTFSHAAEAADRPLEPLGRDAHRPQAGDGPRRVVILVVGETARAANFALNGYERPTNPQLSQRDGVINFERFSACGTSTAVSVPCMFAHANREAFDELEARHTENLLDVLTRAGVAVRWRENNSGCKGVCARIRSEDVSHAGDPVLCAKGLCVDEILLRGLGERIRETEGDLLVVLHEQGSHGPEYYRRYPDRFARFTPVCESNTPQNCTRQAIRNAYDNTIVYTDYVLDRTIDLLQRDARKNGDATALFYLSDHGESLGEAGLYLHGFPYAVAPSSQTHVPAIAWFSSNFGIDAACAQQASKAAHSQDELFDTMLGLFLVTTQAYRPDQDMFRACLASAA